MSLDYHDIETKFLSFIDQSADKLVIIHFLINLNISDVARLIDDHANYGTEIINLLPTNRASKVFKILDITQQKEIIQNLPNDKVAALLNDLPADDRTNFLKDLPQGVIRDLIKLLNPHERKITLSLLGYPEHSVGRLMTPDYIFVSPLDKVGDVLQKIRVEGKKSETIDVIYVVDTAGTLIDDFSIRDLILADPQKTVNECLLDGRVVFLNVHDDQEHAYEIFKMNNRAALPVTDDKKKLLGIVTMDDMLWVAKEEFNEDLQKIGGIEAFNEPYLAMPLLNLFKKRISWLVFLFLGEMLTASAMGYFQHEIEKATVLALFVPLIMSSGGNSGSQASTLIIQALSVGELALSDWWRVLRREIISGILLGSVLASIGFVRIGVWHFLIPSLYGTHWFMLSVTVALAVVGVVLWGTLAGSMLPLILKKLGADPAVSSAPFVATLVDVTGIIIYFTIAYFLLKGILL
ncbi:MAG: magnesium transporter [Phycisphaerales bacterium]|nr:magnesium transporter [Phycisphaerales bacterium]